MIEQVGNLWDFHAAGGWVCITTNGFVTSKGCLIMGAGVAKEARDRYPGLDRRWGDITMRAGQGVILDPLTRLIAFPTKYHWRQPSDLTLIARSATQLVKLAPDQPDKIYLPRPGCGQGRLHWKDVKPVIEPILTDDRFIVVTP